MQRSKILLFFSFDLKHDEANFHHKANRIKIKK